MGAKVGVRHKVRVWDKEQACSLWRFLVIWAAKDAQLRFCETEHPLIEKRPV